MIPRPKRACPRALANTLLFACFLAIGSKAVAQSAITVGDTTGWNPWYTSSGAVMIDPQNDQQTGQHTDDYVGDSTHYGMMQKAGTISGTDYVMFRFRFDDFAGADKFGGNGGNVGLGLDLDGNGSIDVMMVMVESSGNVNNRTRTVYWGTPGAGANTGPSTTTWTIDTNQSTAYSLTVNTTYDLVATNDGYNFATTQDSWLTFAVSFSAMSAGISTYASGFSGFNYTYSSQIAYIAFTSTQTNALNQDLFGASKAALTSGSADNSMTWAQLGAITPLVSASGSRVPEPATYLQLGAFALAGLALYQRRRTRNRADSAK